MGDALLSLLASPIVLGMALADKLRDRVNASRRQRKIAADEAWRDQKALETRATILHLAEALGAEAHEARKAMIRASYLSSGKAPDTEP